MRRVRAVAWVMVTALAVAACSTGGEDGAGEATRNLTFTTPPVKPVVTTTTKPSPFATTTTAPPSPNTTAPNTTVVGVRRNIPSTTSFSESLRGTTSADLTCWVLEVKGDLSAPQISIPYNEILGGQSQSSGLELVTTCDDTVFDAAASDDRVFVLPIDAPKINRYEQVGGTTIAPTQERMMMADLRLIIDPPAVSESIQRNNLGRLSYEYEVQRDASIPASAPARLSGQRTASAPHSGTMSFRDTDECVQVRVRVAEDRSQLDRTGAIRARSDWSQWERVCANPPADNPFVLIAFGDSYGSGEGNPAVPLTRYPSRCAGYWYYDTPCVSRRPYENPELFDYAELGVDELVWGTSGPCHRSSQSGVAKAVDRIIEEWNVAEMYFGHFACSGAVSEHLIDTPYTPAFDGNIAFDFPESYPCEWAWRGTGSCESMPPQIDIANYWLERRGLRPTEVDAVVVSIGGNDAGFSTLVAGCFVVPNATCNDALFRSGNKFITDTLGFDDFWVRSEAMADLRSAITTVANAMLRAYPRAEIFFTTYTDGLSVSPSNPADRDGDGVCSSADLTRGSEWRDDWAWKISPSEARWLQGTMNEINDTIRATVDDVRRGTSRVSVVDAQSQATNNGFCTGPGRRNLTFSDEAIRLQGADFSETLELSAGGWHPNDLGYGLYGAAIADAVLQSQRFLTTYPMRVRD